MIKYFIKNVRRGFATNSSSSHSFVYLKEPVENPSDQGDHYGCEFGWVDFKIETLLGKLMYWLTDQVSGWDAREAYNTYKDTLPELSEEDFREAAHGYVDHQSRGTISLEQARDPHVVVFGGNDNGGESRLRARTVASGAVDWDKTEHLWDDEVSRDVLPIQSWDLVTYQGETWTVDRADQQSADLRRYNTGKYQFDVAGDVPVSELKLESPRDL